MVYVRFTKTFLDSLVLQSSEQINLDNVLQGYLKNFLFNNRSFAQTQDELNEVKTNIEETYKHLLQVVLPQYTEAVRLSGTKTRLHTRDLTQNYGNERAETSVFEPLKDNTQQELKAGASNTTWQPDTTQETIEEEEYNDNLALKELYDSLVYKISMFFGRYVNNLFFGGED